MPALGKGVLIDSLQFNRYVGTYRCHDITTISAFLKYVCSSKQPHIRNSFINGKFETRINTKCYMYILECEMKVTNTVYWLTYEISQ